MEDQIEQLQQLHERINDTPVLLRPALAFIAGICTFVLLFCILHFRVSHEVSLIKRSFTQIVYYL